ncbi:MAG: T9SS type A sorting domain-containing protein, partial [Flavobacterium sp.]|nr:T9SS type A sorting domain-containing protein [Flavobacterium sp.]
MKLLPILIFLLSCTTVSATDYYISSSGNDANNGISISTPWKTITKVNSKFSTLNPGDKILFNRGDAFYGSLVISKSGASGSPITIGAYGAGEKPIITGFTNVTAWTNLGSNIWESTNAVSTLSTCNMVVVNGANTPRGRYPNSGYFPYQTFSGNTSITSSSINSATADWTSAEVVIKKHRWIIDRNPIISHSGGTLTYKPSSYYYGRNDWGFFIQNDVRTLDTTNEWYYNPSTNKISIYSISPPKDVKVATVDTLVFTNEKSYLTFDNILFTGSNTSSIWNKNSRYVTVQNCDFTYSGTDAFHGENWGNSTYLTIRKCSFDQTNNDAIICKTSYSNAKIQNNIIRNTGMIAGMGGSGDDTYSAILLTSSANSLIEGNEVDSTGYNAIHFPGYNSGSVDNTIVTKNFVNYFNLIKDDGGGIYTHTAGSGKVISYNIVLNGIGNNDGMDASYAATKEAMGIYIDRNYETSGVSVLNNTIENAANSGIFLNGTHDITIRNNTIYNNTFSGFRASDGESGDIVEDILFKNNIVIAKGDNQLGRYVGAENTNAAIFNNQACDSNYFANPIANSNIFRVQLGSPTWVWTIYNLSSFHTYSGQEGNSTKTSLTANELTNIRFEYNATSTAKTISLAYPMIDVKGAKYASSVTLQPYTSVVLIKDPFVVPGVPTSVVASAGDAIASVTFAAPANNGGSAITGYTVTSIPAGGTDLNAGSTSLTHSITGLTNGASYAFTVKATNSAGTSIASIASNAVTPLAPVATAFTLSGPSGGNVNSASSNFTVTPNYSYTGTITITPTGTGSTGLAARVLTYSNSSAAQTFTILPATAGSITLTPTNSGAITNPVGLAYTANTVSPGVPTSVVASAGDAIASVTFAAPANNGGSAITGYTVTSIPAGGTDLNAGSTSLIHSITGLTNGTSYTFTVKTTNSAGTSIASSVSNAVIPIDITLPVISAFTIPSTANSRTVSISRFTATDNTGITGYLLTETAAVPSTGSSVWTSAAPSTYIFSSDGFKALYAWVKDAAGNVSALRYEAVIINSNLTAEPDAHFKTVWQGENGQNQMNMNVVSATLEGMQLSVADEIALFSGADCVGAIKLKKSINLSDQSTFITIHAAQDDGSNNGFADNDTIIFKIWDSKNQLEILVNSVTYKNDIASWNTSGKYVSGATSTVKIEAFTGISQTIVLKKGYNLISTYLNANYPNVTAVTKSLYDQGNLVKIQDESGNSFENWGTYGGWINKIGTLENTEGYKIQVENNCTLQVIGKPVTLPMDIPLKTGWNIISFPYNDLVNAKSVIQSLIDQNRLSKVQDEEGNSIEDWGQFGGWINGIGNFVPGKGYKVKVTTNAILTLQQSYLKSVVIMAKSEKTVHFTTNIEGNGSEHMNINIVGLRASGISVGDELAAYDGKICVGTIKINDEHINTESASLVTSFSSSEQAGDGFTEGHPINIIAWNRITDSEKVVQGEVVNGKLSYLKNSSVLLKLKTQSIDVKSLKDAVQIDLYPNPTTGIVTVRFSEMPVKESRIEIVDISGRMIISRQVTNIAEVFNLENQTSGIYLVKIKTGLNQIINKLILTK